jgi:hypothetical protein
MKCRVTGIQTGNTSAFTIAHAPLFASFSGLRHQVSASALRISAIISQNVLSPENFPPEHKPVAPYQSSK